MNYVSKNWNLPFASLIEFIRSSLSFLLVRVTVGNVLYRGKSAFMALMAAVRQALINGGKRSPRAGLTCCGEVFKLSFK